jgi:hypothetical protein
VPDTMSILFPVASVVDADPLGLCDTMGRSASYTEVVTGKARWIVGSGCPNHFAQCQRADCDGMTPARTSSARVRLASYELPANPQLRTPAYAKLLQCEPGAVGIAFNGVPIYGRNDGRSTCIDMIPHIAGNIDACGGYADPQSGFYHYSVPPACLLAQQRELYGSTAHSPQLGWSLDGFPIYGSRGPDGITMQRCDSAGFLPGTNSRVCLDACYGYEADLLQVDVFRYRYYMMGPIGNLSCSSNVTNAGACEGSCCINEVPDSAGGASVLPCRRGCLISEIEGNMCLNAQSGVRSDAAVKVAMNLTEPAYLTMSSPT